MQKIPNRESGCLDPAQSLISCATPEKSLNASLLYFSPLQDEKFRPYVGQRALLPETGFGPLLQHGTRATTDDGHLAQQASLPYDSSPHLQFSSTRQGVTLGQCLKHPFVVKSFPLLSGDAPSPMLELWYPGTPMANWGAHSAHWSCHSHARPLPETSSPAHTTQRTAHKR